jgi:hypothetical protein
MINRRTCYLIASAATVAAALPSPALAKLKPLTDAQYSKCIKRTSNSNLDTSINVSSYDCTKENRLTTSQSGLGSLQVDPSFYFGFDKESGEKSYNMRLLIKYSFDSSSFKGYRVGARQIYAASFEQGVTSLKGKLVRLPFENRLLSGPSCYNVPNALMRVTSCDLQEFATVALSREGLELFLAEYPSSDTLMTIKLTGQSGDTFEFTIDPGELRASLKTFDAIVGAEQTRN